jgi:hypothetical protein
VSFLGSLVPLLLIIAGIVTPLGLSNDGVAVVEHAIPFAIVQDDSVFGRASVPRSEYSYNRVCGFEEWIPCPGTSAPLVSQADGALAYAYGNTSIADNITATFSSGTGGRGNTISSVFDIRMRHYTQEEDLNGFIDNGRPRTVESFRFGQSFILNSDFEVIDGLVIDPQYGGIGFRNHTAPIGLPQSSSWTEDILWIEPLTSCVNLNLSVEFQLDGLYITKAFLVDEGGFADLPPQGMMYDNRKPQENPDLFGRALYTAINGNILVAQHLNISYGRSWKGAKYKLPLEFPGVEPWQDLMGKLADPADYVERPTQSVGISRVGRGWIVEIPGLDGESNGVSLRNFIELGMYVIYPSNSSCSQLMAS